MVWKYWIIGLGILICFRLAAAEQIVGGVAVVVNEAIITYKDLIQYINPVIDRINLQYSHNPEERRKRLIQAQEEGIQQLIERQLILQEFKRAGYQIPDYIVEQEVKRRIREQFGGDRISLIRTLQAQGLTYDKWRERVKEDLIISAMRAKYMGGEIVVSPTAIEQYYVTHLDEFKLGDQVKLRTIMINKSGRGKDHAYALALELLKQLKNGASFEDIARIYSEDGMGRSGGDRGWITKYEIRPELAQIAFTMEVGQLSDIIDTEDSFWIIRVEGIRKNHVKTLEEVRDEIAAKLKEQERERRYRQWIETLKKKAYIRYY